MKKRLFTFKLAKKLCGWGLKQVLTALPIVGALFNFLFTGMEIVKEVKEALAESAETVPLYAFA
ncbi:MAG TPA: hypothetical protein V6C72_03185 [Chroococcales cyanobacterium]